LRNGGPLGILLGYVLFGTICYSVTVGGGHPPCLIYFFLNVRVDHNSQASVGEMISYLPIPGGHIKPAERFVNGPLSFVRDFAIWS
jgi:amino acid transporter